MIKDCIITRVRTILIVLCSIPVISATAHAELFLSLEARESYDDNVIGLTADNRAGTTGPFRGGMASLTAAQMQGGPSGMPGPGGSGGTGTTSVQQKGDFSTNLFANIGYDGKLGSGLTPFVQGTVDHTRFNTYSEFDFTIATVSAGAGKAISDRISVTVQANGSWKNFANDLRDGTAYGGSIAIRERLSPSFRAKQFYEIEQNRADASFYSYFGQSAGITAGLDVTERSTVGIGYTYFLRDYREAAPPVTVTSQLASLDWVMDLSDYWSIAAGYDREWADSDIPDTATTNNRYWVGIRYEY